MIKDVTLKSLSRDIRFWILFFFVLRLVGITNPPLEISHNWRQCLTNMIARNFLADGPSLFYPRIDMAGQESGVIGSEFPFFNYLIFLFSKVFGFKHWYGRLINLIISSFGIWFFYKLTEKLCNARVAFAAALILLSSIWFSFSRKIMPDTFSVSLVLVGLFYCYRFLSDGKLVHLFLYFIFSTAGILCKIPAFALMGMLAGFMLMHNFSVKNKTLLVITTLVTFSIVYLWYFYWVPGLIRDFHYQLYFPKGILEGWSEIRPLLPELMEKFYFSAFSSYLALVVFLIGIIFFIKGSNQYLKYSVLVISFIFGIFILKTGSIFPLHNYYIIPFVPVMAIIAGYGIIHIPLKFRFIVLSLICIEGIANQQHDFFIKIDQKYKLSLENISEDVIGKNQLVIINGGQSPQQIYFLNRKGWTVENSMITKKSLDSLHTLGASFLVLNTLSYPAGIDYYDEVKALENYKIYKME